MSGCRALTESEIERVRVVLNTKRNQCLFIMGLRTGFRISELLSLKVSDVYVGGKVLDQVRAHGKGNKSRLVVLHSEAKAAIVEMLTERGLYEVNEPLFLSNRRYWNGEAKALSRFMAHKVLKEACLEAEVGGAVATHSMRKTFAERVYNLLDKDLVATQHALGHSDIRSTASYICVNQSAINAAILK